MYGIHVLKKWTHKAAVLMFGAVSLVGASLSSVWAQAMLENPQPGSFQSGIGVISGWACTAGQIIIEIDGALVLPAAYGTDRTDTMGVCGDDGNNGFGLLVNWNRLGDGVHTLRALADGVEFGRAMFTVTTLGEEFLRGVHGSVVVPNFPHPGASVTLQWQQPLQNFVITAQEESAAIVADPSAVLLPATSLVLGVLENPSSGSSQSGVNVVSGWFCAAERIEIEIDGVTLLPAAYGTERPDTMEVCGDDGNNGFGLLVNWNRLGDGVHTLRALADGVEFGQATFTVMTLREEFVRGVSGRVKLKDFPQAGTDVTLQWQESLQNFVIVEKTVVPPPCANIAGRWNASEQGSVTCKIAGITETEEFEGEEIAIISQQECKISWKPAGFNTPRTGVITGNTFTASGAFVVANDAFPGVGVTFTQNSASIQGTIQGNTIHMTGSGKASGRVCLDEDEDCHSFSCTGTSTTTFTR